MHGGSLKEITNAARLAYHGMLGFVDDMGLRDVDLASVPVEHLASLASCVTKLLVIDIVRNCDLTSILNNLKSELLFIYSQTLTTEETRALVRAMESRVETVLLAGKGEVKLDIRALTQYSGQRKCEEVKYIIMIQMKNTGQGGAEELGQEDKLGSCTL